MHLLYADVAEKIERQIRNSDWPIGTQLPSERKLADQYHVSRNVVRRALSQLKEGELIELKPGDGAYVTYRCDEKSLLHMVALKNMMIKNDVTFLQALEVRQMLEVAIVKKCVPYMDGDKMETLEDLYDEMEKCHNCRDIDRFVKYDTQFHDSLARCIPNPMFHLLLKTYMDIVPDFTVMSRTLNAVFFDMQSTQEEHRTILDALYAHDEAKAEKAMLEHMRKIRRDLEQLKNKRIPEDEK